MKKLLFIVLLAVISLGASAQYRVTSIDNSDQPGNPIRQIIQTDSTTLVYACFTSPENHSNVTINRATAAYVDGMKYKLISSANIPIQDDADQKYTHLDNAGDVVNYVMMFEKFPVENGFDIIENKTKHNASMFNFEGIHVEKVEPSELIDTKRFLDSSEFPISGRYVRDGVHYYYYIRDGIVVTTNCTVNGKDLRFYINIVNDSDHGVMFDFDKVYLVGTKKKNGVDTQSTITKYTPESFDAKVAGRRYDNEKYSGKYTANHELGHILYRESHNSSNSELERVALGALGILNSKIENDSINKYLEEHPDTSPKTIKSTSLEPGDTTYGYVASKNQKFDKAQITIEMDGYKFFFDYQLK